MTVTFDVVGCRHCENIWILRADPTIDTASCSRCGHTHRRSDLRALADCEAGDEQTAWQGAAEHRARILATRADEADRYVEQGTFQEQADRVDERFRRDLDLYWDEVEASFHRQAERFSEQVETTLETHRQIGSERAESASVTYPDADLWAAIAEDRVDAIAPAPVGSDRTGRVTEPLVEHPAAETWREQACRSAAEFGTHDPNQNRPDVDLKVRPAQSRANATLHSGAGARYSEWMPAILEELFDDLIAALEDLLERHGRLQATEILLPAPAGDTWTDDQRSAAEWLAALTRYVDNPPDKADELRADLCELGTTDDSWNSGLSAIYYGPIRLIKQSSIEPEVDITLDERAWSAAPRGPRRRSLAALSVLGAGIDVVVFVKKELRDQIRDRHSIWTERHLNLNEDQGWSHLLGRVTEDSETVNQTVAAQEVVDELPAPSKQVDLLSVLDPNRPRTVQSLDEDPGHDVASGSLYRYLGKLERLGCVEIESRHPSNRVHLTDVGEEVQANITDDGSLLDPVQTTFAELSDEEGRLNATTQPVVGSVCGAPWESEGGKDAQQQPRAEAHLAATGDVDEDGDHIRFLEGPESYSSWWMHQRYAAPARDAAVTLVDDRHHERFENGKTVYLSGDFDDDRPDEVLAMVQWGKPLPTLGRIAGALLSDAAWSRFLSSERVGNDLSTLDSDVVQDLDDNLEDVLRWGHQMGWLSEDDFDRDSYRERLNQVRFVCWEKIAQLVDSDDWAARGELMERLHGLIATVTHLYYAAGYDLTINIRVPDTSNIVRDELRHRSFLTFLQKLVPKQTVFRFHSGYRMLLEDRVEKLQTRLGYSDDLEAISNAQMEYTAKFVVSGRAATEFQSDLVAAFEQELGQVREDVRDGREQTAVMDLSVAIGNSLTAIEEIVEDLAVAKGYRLGESGCKCNALTSREAARIMLRALATEGYPHRACPYAVAEAMLRIRRTNTGEYLQPEDLAAGISRLPIERFMPSIQADSRGHQQRQTPARIFQTLLSEDKPMRRHEIIDAADICGGRFGQYIEELHALDLVVKTEKEGRTAWRATIAPWWSSTPDFCKGDVDKTMIPADPRDRHLLFEVVAAAASHIPDFPCLTELSFNSPPDLYEETMLAKRWQAFLVNSLPVGSLSTPPPYETETDVEIVREGCPPDASTQSGLDYHECRQKEVMSGDGKTRPVLAESNND